MLTKNEIIGISSILLVIFVMTYFNLVNSVMLARDVQRKNDLKHIGAALTNYTKQASTYPASREGKIVSCGENFGQICRWGLDPLESSASAVMDRIPNDPSWAEKVFYLYRSNTRDFQIYAHLEGEDDEINKEIESKGFLCGVKICNFGLGSSNDFPLTENIENLSVNE